LEKDLENTSQTLQDLAPPVDIAITAAENQTGKDFTSGETLTREELDNRNVDAAANLLLPSVDKILDLLRFKKTCKAVNTSGPVGPTLPNNTTRGWRLGDPINNLTASGRVPSWSAVRQRFWKNEAHFNPDNYSKANLARMRQGLAPQRINPRTGQLESMELHHTPPQRDGGLFDVRPVWPGDHALIDPFRRTGN
jgi:hypothetical protein